MSKIKNKDKFILHQDSIRKFLLSRNFDTDYMCYFQQTFIDSYLEFQDKFDETRIETLSDKQKEKKEFSFLLTNVKRKIFNLHKKHHPREKNKNSTDSQINEYARKNKEKEPSSTIEVNINGLIPPNLNDYKLNRLKLVTETINSSNKSGAKRYIEFELQELKRSLWSKEGKIKESTLFRIVSEGEKTIDYLDFEIRNNEAKSVTKILYWQSI
ncbi:MAG: hypothetical protein ABJL44_15460 [Algibacter sp.]